MEQTLFRLLLTTKLKAQQAHCHKNTGLKANRDHHPNQLNNGLKAYRDHHPEHAKTGQKAQRDHHPEQTKNGLKAQRDHSPGQRPGNTGQRPGNTCESIMNALKEQHTHELTHTLLPIQGVSPTILYTQGVALGYKLIGLSAHMITHSLVSTNGGGVGQPANNRPCRGDLYGTPRR